MVVTKNCHNTLKFLRRIIEEEKQPHRGNKPIYEVFENNFSSKIFKNELDLHNFCDNVNDIVMKTEPKFIDDLCVHVHYKSKDIFHDGYCSDHEEQEEIDLEEEVVIYDLIDLEETRALNDGDIVTDSAILWIYRKEYERLYHCDGCCDGGIYRIVTHLEVRKK